MTDPDEPSLSDRATIAANALASADEQIRQILWAVKQGGNVDLQNRVDAVSQAGEWHMRRFRELRETL